MSFDGRLRYGVLGALSLLYFLLMAFTFNSLGQVLPFMVPDLGMNWGQAGFGFTLLGVACGAASMLPAMTIRMLGVARTLMIGTLLLIGGFGALALGTSVFAYYAGATLLGLGYCFCGTVPAVHIICSIFHKRSTALGVYYTLGNLGAVAGPLFFYAVSEAFAGWRTYWLFCAAAMLAAGIIAAAVTRIRAVRAAPETPGAPAAAATTPLQGWSVKAALATPQFWVIVGAYTACLLVNTTVHSFAFQHLLENGQSKGSATAVISLAALVSAIAAGAAGLIGERMAPRRLTMLSLASLALTSLCLTLPQQPVAVYLFALTFGVGLGFSWVSTAMLLQDYFGQKANLELYSIMTAVSTFAAVGPGIGGVVRDDTGSFSAVFAGLAVINLALALAVLAMRKPAAHETDVGLIFGSTEAHPG